MAAEEFSVDTDALNRDGQQLRQGAMKIEAQLAGLRDSVTALGRVSEGEAVEMWRAEVALWLDRFQAMCGHIRKLADQIQDAAAAYQKGDAEAERAVNSIHCGGGTRL